MVSVERGGCQGRGKPRPYPITKSATRPVIRYGRSLPLPCNIWSILLLRISNLAARKRSFRQTENSVLEGGHRAQESRRNCRSLVYFSVGRAGHPPPLLPLRARGSPEPADGYRQSSPSCQSEPVAGQRYH